MRKSTKIPHWKVHRAFDDPQERRRTFLLGTNCGNIQGLKRPEPKVSGGKEQISVRHPHYLVIRPHLTPSDSGSNDHVSLETEDRFARASKRLGAVQVPAGGEVVDL